MAQEVPGFRPGVFVAGADLSTSQYLAVKLDANGKLVLAGDGDLAAGILQEEPILDEAAEIDMDGVSKAVFGATVLPGEELMSNAAGKLIPATGSTKRVVAVALIGGAVDTLGSVKVVGLSGRALV